MAAGVMPSSAGAGQGGLHVEPGLKGCGLREQRAHAEFVDPQKDWLSSRDGQPLNLTRVVLPPASHRF